MGFPLYFKNIISNWPKFFWEIDHGCFRVFSPYFIGKSPRNTCRLTFECWSIIVRPNQFATSVFRYKHFAWQTWPWTSEKVLTTFFVYVRSILPPPLSILKLGGLVLIFFVIIWNVNIYWDSWIISRFFYNILFATFFLLFFYSY